ncbi:MAG: hypothetical protein AAGK47_06570 [Bacteroidota bacterium]
MMIRILYSSLLVLLMMTTATAQKKIKQGIIRYVITDIHTDVPEMELMKGSTLELFFSTKKQKVRMNLMRGAMITETIIDHKTGESIMLTELMGRKVRIDNAKPIKHSALRQQGVIYDKDATKDIAGYRCHKAIIRNTDGERLVAYITNRIAPRSDYLDHLFMGLEGFPLEYTVVNNEVAITFTAEEVTDHIDASAFYVLGEYEKMSEEAFRTLMGDFDLGLGY